METLATVQQRAVSNFFVLPGQGSTSASAGLLSIEGEHVAFFSWSNDGNLLTSDYTRLLRTDVSGKSPTVLASDPAAGIIAPSMCGAKYVVFPWAFHAGTNSIGLWRVNADGSHPMQLTDGGDDGWSSSVTCSGNHDWVYFFRDTQHIWRVPLNETIDGVGKPEPVSASAIGKAFQAGRGMGISPDGKTLAYLVEFMNPESGVGTTRIALLDLTTMSAPRLLDPNPHVSAGPQFTNDGTAIAYPIRENGVDNVWTQPLDGSPGRQITNFDAEQILSFHWSPDTKNLGILRGHTDSDVVLLQEAKP